MRLLLSVLAFALLATAPASAGDRTGPSGDAFYTPPSPLPSGTHGDPIWTRRLTGPAALAGARVNRLVLYRSNSPDGTPIAVSGTVAVPRGKAPRGGWPLLTWGHGTKGLADACTPSKGYGMIDSETLLLRSWLQRGYAIARTDYEGLGTPGVHPFLVGRSAGRGILDAARAARELFGSIGRRVVIGGESQGGHAALWAGADAPRWTPELRVRATLALAPVSQLREQGQAFAGLDATGLSAYAAMILRGIDVVNPGLGIPSLLSDRTLSLLGFADTECGSRLDDEDRFGPVRSSEFFRPGADLTAGFAALEANDVGNARIASPVQIAQGTADTTVLKPFTDRLVEELEAKRTNVRYRVYEGAGHGGDLMEVAAVRRDALAFTRRRVGR